MSIESSTLPSQEEITKAVHYLQNNLSKFQSPLRKVANDLFEYINQAENSKPREKWNFSSSSKLFTELRTISLQWTDGKKKKISLHLHNLTEWYSRMGCEAFSTTHNLERFADCVRGCEGKWVIHHFTSYTKSQTETAIPTDHGSLRLLPTGYRMTIADGFGHWEPIEIGKVAAEIVSTTQKGILQTRPFFFDTIKSLATRWKQREGTTLLQAELIATKEGGFDVTLGVVGDSDLILLNNQGQVVFATVDRKSHLSKMGKEIGLIGIGANFSEEWLDEATYLQFHHLHTESFAVACSDGLTECFRNSDGTIDKERFTYAALHGFFLPIGELPPQSEVAQTPLDAELIATNLRKSAFAAAAYKKQEEKRNLQRKLEHQQVDGNIISSQLDKVHAGDDVTLIVVHLNNP